MAKLKKTKDPIAAVMKTFMLLPKKSPPVWETPPDSRQVREMSLRDLVYIRIPPYGTAFVYRGFDRDFLTYRGCARVCEQWPDIAQHNWHVLKDPNFWQYVDRTQDARGTQNTEHWEMTFNYSADRAISMETFVQFFFREPEYETIIKITALIDQYHAHRHGYPSGQFHWGADGNTCEGCEGFFQKDIEFITHHPHPYNPDMIQKAKNLMNTGRNVQGEVKQKKKRKITFEE